MESKLFLSGDVYILIKKKNLIQATGSSLKKLSSVSDYVTKGED